MSDNPMTTRHWVVSYGNKDGTFGAQSIWLDKPHELIVTKVLWEEARCLMQERSSGSIVLSMTPRNETS